MRKGEGEGVWGGGRLMLEVSEAVGIKDVCLGRQGNEERQRVEIRSHNGQEVHSK